MANKNRDKWKITKTVRIPLPISDDLDRALKTRYDKKLISVKELTHSEAMRLIGRMPEWNLALEKLSKLPKKEDLKW